MIIDPERVVYLENINLQFKVPGFSAQPHVVISTMFHQMSAYLAEQLQAYAIDVRIYDIRVIGVEPIPGTADAKVHMAWRPETVNADVELLGTDTLVEVPRVTEQITHGSRTWDLRGWDDIRHRWAYYSEDL